MIRVFEQYSSFVLLAFSSKQLGQISGNTKAFWNYGLNNTGGVNQCRKRQKQFWEPRWQQSC